MAEPLEYQLDVDVNPALQAVDAVDTALQAAAADFSAALEIDASPLTSEVSTAIDSADTAVTVEADAGPVTDSVSDAVDSADTLAAIDADAGTVTDEVSDAVDSADTLVNVTADASAVTDAVNQAVDAADTDLSGAAGGLEDVDQGAQSAQVSVAGIGKEAAKVGAIVGAGLGAREALDAVINLDTGVREILTLLGEAGQAPDAFENLRDDVAEFADDTGRLTGEVIPAVYDAISAGVPRENVFDFLQRSNDLALAGATDLGSAVDILTTIINAYGLEIDQAGRVSDTTFQAVVDGKTTVDELAASLFQTIPTAAAFGVELGDVTAAIATLAAQGTPTRVAATQIRQLLAELAKEGTATSDTFERIAGQSFPAFIAESGDVAGALALLDGEAQDLDVSLFDLFGSVEAGNAALGLGGDNAEAYAENLDNVADSAGVTTNAAEILREGLDQTRRDILRTAESLLQDLGPALEATLTLLEQTGERAGEVAGPTGEVLGRLADLQGAVDAPDASNLEKIGGVLTNTDFTIFGVVDKLHTVADLFDSIGGGGEGLLAPKIAEFKAAAEAAEETEEAVVSLDQQVRDAQQRQVPLSADIRIAQEARSQIEGVADAYNLAGEEALVYDSGLQAVADRHRRQREDLRELERIYGSDLVQATDDVTLAFALAADAVASGNQELDEVPEIIDAIGVSSGEASDLIAAIGDAVDDFVQRARDQIPTVGALFRDALTEGGTPGEIIDSLREGLANQVGFALALEKLGEDGLDALVGVLAIQGPEVASEAARALAVDPAAADELNQLAEDAETILEETRDRVGEVAEDVAPAGADLAAAITDTFGETFSPSLLAEAEAGIRDLEAYLAGVTISTPGVPAAGNVPPSGRQAERQAGGDTILNIDVTQTDPSPEEIGRAVGWNIPQ